ncbi:MAG: hypothetical protein ACKO7B_18055, partial [Flavobacteriales bacterium]
ELAGNPIRLATQSYEVGLTLDDNHQCNSVKLGSDKIIFVLLHYRLFAVGDFYKKRPINQDIILFLGLFPFYRFYVDLNTTPLFVIW